MANAPTKTWKLKERKVMRPMEAKPRKDYTLENWDGTVLATIFDANDNGKSAALIAAAPDMLEALKKLACLGNGDQPGNSIGNQIALAAIAKAETSLSSEQAA